MTKLAKLIAEMEGFGKPGAIPTTHNNPGDLRHSPHSEHPGDPNAIGQIDTVEHGWEDLDFELRLIATRHPNITLIEFVAGNRDESGNVLPGGYPGWAPEVDHNNPVTYSQFLSDGLQLSVTVALTQALQVQEDSQSE